VAKALAGAPEPVTARRLGITVDDVLAAVYVNLVVLLVYAGKSFLVR